MSSSTSNSTMGSMTSMSKMMVTFFFSTSTPLYSIGWTPSTTRGYAGTCIFIIILAIIFRCLHVYKPIQERKLRNIELKRRPIIVSDKKNDDEGATTGNNDDGAGNESGEKYWPWRWRADVPRALLDTVTACVGYLLSVVLHSI